MIGGKMIDCGKVPNETWQTITFSEASRLIMFIMHYTTKTFYLSRILLNSHIYDVQVILKGKLTKKNYTHQSAFTHSN